MSADLAQEVEIVECPAVDAVYAAYAEVERRREEEEGEEEDAELERLIKRLLFSPSLRFSEKTSELRRIVATKGLPKRCLDEREGRVGDPTDPVNLRALVWKVLLGSVHIDANHYLELINKGPCWKEYGIRQDTFRTFPTIEDFWERVDEGQITRILSAFARLNFTPRDYYNFTNNRGHVEEVPDPEEYSPVKPPIEDFGGFTQGMTNIAGIFLHTMPESDAFFCLNAMLTKHCPKFVGKNLKAVYETCDIIEVLLDQLDPELSDHIQTAARVYAFPYVCPFLSSLSPLSEAKKLWDFMFAAGIHFAPLLFVGLLILMRDQLLESPKPYDLLHPRVLASATNDILDAEMIIAATRALIPFLSEEMKETLMLIPVEAVSIPSLSSPSSSSSPPPQPHFQTPDKPTMHRASSHNTPSPKEDLSYEDRVQRLHLLVRRQGSETYYHHQPVRPPSPSHGHHRSQGSHGSNSSSSSSSSSSRTDVQSSQAPSPFNPRRRPSYLSSGSQHHHHNHQSPFGRNTGGMNRRRGSFTHTPSRLSGRGEFESSSWRQEEEEEEPNSPSTKTTHRHRAYLHAYDRRDLNTRKKLGLRLKEEPYSNSEEERGEEKSPPAFGRGNQEVKTKRDRQYSFLGRQEGLGGRRGERRFQNATWSK